jgi:hypothetical protein
MAAELRLGNKLGNSATPVTRYAFIDGLHLKSIVQKAPRASNPFNGNPVLVF